MGTTRDDASVIEAPIHIYIYVYNFYSTSLAGREPKPTFSMQFFEIRSLHKYLLVKHSARQANIHAAETSSSHLALTDMGG